jgi:hypothetical protein
MCWSPFKDKIKADLTAMFRLYLSDSRTQFKEMQKNKAGFLHNFYFEFVNFWYNLTKGSGFRGLWLRAASAV